MMTIADMLAEFGIQLPDREPSRYILGLPGWRFCIGYDISMDEYYTLQWAWRCRENRLRGAMRYHFYLKLRFGRSHVSVTDIGGPFWWPRLIKRWGSQAYAVPASRWTGHQYEIVGIDWPKLEFKFFKIPEDADERQ